MIVCIFIFTVDFVVMSVLSSVVITLFTCKKAAVAQEIRVNSTSCKKQQHVHMVKTFLRNNGWRIMYYKNKPKHFLYMLHLHWFSLHPWTSRQNTIFLTLFSPLANIPQKITALFPVISQPFPLTLNALAVVRTLFGSLFDPLFSPLTLCWSTLHPRESDDPWSEEASRSPSLQFPLTDYHQTCWNWGLRTLSASP